MRLTVTFRGRRMALDLDAAVATMRDVRAALYELCRVPPERQRLVLAGGRRPPPCTADDAPLRVVFGDAARADCLLIGEAEVSTSPTDAAVGSSGNADQQAVGAVQEARSGGDCDPTQRLIARQCETADGLYQCSYIHGHTQLECFVCRTCVDAGIAAAEHVLCVACADVCHQGHDVESWGRRINVRCDCCTVAFDDRHACQFVVDERDPERLPATVKLPRNTANRYPRDPRRFCFCGEGRRCRPPTRHHHGRAAVAPDEDEDGDDDDDEDDFAQCCALCGQCFWNSHLTRLFTRQMRHVACYGQVALGDVVAYHCRTCGVWVCSACSVRCHRTHDLDLANPTVPARHGQRDERLLLQQCSDFVFSCGCGGSCAIANEVPAALIAQEEEAEKAGAAEGPALLGSAFLPPEVAADLLDNDEFVNFVCGWCMQDHPWLAAHRLDHCHHGGCPQPLATPNSEVLPIVCAGQDQAEDQADQEEDEDEEEEEEEELRSEGTREVPQRARSSRGVGAPAATFAFHGMLVPEHFLVEFGCQCEACQAFFEQVMPGCHRAQREQAVDLFFATKEPCTGCGTKIARGFICVTCAASLGEGAQAGAGAAPYLCDACHARLPEIGHPPNHEFAPDSFDVLWRLFGVSLLRAVDPQLQHWMVDNWNTRDAKELFFDMLRATSTAKRPRERVAGAGRSSDSDEEPPE